MTRREETGDEDKHGDEDQAPYQGAGEGHNSQQTGEPPATNKLVWTQQKNTTEAQRVRRVAPNPRPATIASLGPGQETLPF